MELNEYFDLCGWDTSSVKNLVESLTFTYLTKRLTSAYEESSIDLKDLP